MSGPRTVRKLGKAIGKGVKAARLALDIPGRELAERARVPASSLSLYEQGKADPSSENLGRMSAELRAPVPILAGLAAWVRLFEALGAEAAASLDPGEGLEVLALHAGQLTEAFVRGLGFSALAAEGRRAPAAATASAPENLWKVLAALPGRLRHVAVAEGEEYHSLGLCTWICEASARSAGDMAGGAIDMAEVAVKVSEHADLDPAGRARLQGFAWGFVGNARRVGGSLPSAEEAFARSEVLWAEGGAAGLPLDESRLWDLKASLRREQGRCREALDLLDRALAVAASAGARARLLIKKALTFERQGDLAAAVLSFQAAGPDVDAEHEPRQAFSWVMGLARVLLTLDRVDEAAALLPQAHALALRFGNELDTLRTRWLEARLAEAQGDRPAAIAALDGLAAAFLRYKIPFDAALALLELAVLYLEDGDTAKVKELTLQLAPVFAAQQVPQEALANLRLFYEAAQRETLTLAAAREALAALRRAGGGPGSQRND